MNEYDSYKGSVPGIVYRARTAVRLLELTNGVINSSSNDRVVAANKHVLSALDLLTPFTMEDDEPGDGYPEIRAAYGLTWRG